MCVDVTVTFRATKRENAKTRKRENAKTAKTAKTAKFKSFWFSGFLVFLFSRFRMVHRFGYDALFMCLVFLSMGHCILAFFFLLRAPFGQYGPVAAI